jgi:Mg-chelatase subunit ChlD
MPHNTSTPDERLRRWRLILGEPDGTEVQLLLADINLDRALDALYGGPGPDQGGAGGSGGRGGGRMTGPPGGASRQGGLGKSAPDIARWLGDIRKYFPSSVVRVMQKDALERLNLKQMLLQPEMLEAVEPDVHLVGTLLALNKIMPDETRDTARQVVRKVVEELMRRLENPTRQAVKGSLNRAARTSRPRLADMDWNRTIRVNLKHYQPEYKTIIPERRIGFGRKQNALREVILCLDQSGSMAASVVYASIFGAVLASMPALQTRMVVFDTAVVDLTEALQDPVDLLFGTQLGGGTDINRALTYCQSLIRRPSETILVLISDLYEGGDQTEMLKRAASIALSGVQMIALLALSDDGAPGYSHYNAAALASFGVPCFACTPDQFPDMMAAAINRRDLSRWASENDIAVASPGG